MKKLLFLLIPLFMLTGCAPKPHYKVVEQIHITSPLGEYRYDTPDKVQKYLYYLRSLKTWGPAELDTLQGKQYRITLHYSDGSSRIYRQWGNQCLAIGSGGWKKIRSDNGNKLPLLLEAVPPDEKL